MTATITKTEVKNLLKRRSELLFSHDQLKNNLYYEGLSNIYKSGRNDISSILYKIDTTLVEYVNRNEVGKWLMQIRGMDLHTAASLIAYFDITDKECAAQFISYAGLDGKKPHSDIGKILHMLKSNFINEDNYYYKLSVKKATSLIVNEKVDPDTALIRAERYMMKLFISHLFEEMYRVEHDGELPERYNDIDNLIIEPEIPYTK